MDSKRLEGFFSNQFFNAFSSVFLEKFQLNTGTSLQNMITIKLGLNRLSTYHCRHEIVLATLINQYEVFHTPWRGIKNLSYELSFKLSFPFNFERLKRPFLRIAHSSLKYPSRDVSEKKSSNVVYQFFFQSLWQRKIQRGSSV